MSLLIGAFTVGLILSLLVGVLSAFAFFAFPISRQKAPLRSALRGRETLPVNGTVRCLRLLPERRRRALAMEQPPA
jgi:hypothetical protein